MRYEWSAEARQALRALVSQDGARSARVVLITGAPGVGKTAFAEAASRELGALFFYALLHPWSGADDLFYGVDVAAAVAGDADAVRQPGVLARVAEASVRELVVLCLDELDKAPESVEALLLDWLQSGRVPVRPGEHLQTRLESVIVVITSNGTRPHTDALLRRCRRLRLGPMPEDLRVRLAAERSGAPTGVARLVDRACQEIARAEGNEALSLQEIAHACHEVWAIAQSPAEVREALRSWAARTDDGAAAVDRPEIERLIGAIWGEVAAARRRAR
jgi:MoxR-like ATPase